MKNRLHIFLHATLLCVFAMTAAMATAQQHDARGQKKALKSIYYLLKDNKPKEALNMVQKFEKDSAFATNPQLTQYGVQAYERLNAIENERLYLGQEKDTTKLFGTIFGIFDYVLKTDSLESLKEGQKPRFRRSGAALLNTHYGNLDAASSYFFQRTQNEAARRAASTLIESSRSAIFSDNIRPATTDRMLTRNALRHLAASYFGGEYAEAFRYSDIALRDSANHALALQYLILSALGTGDSIRAYNMACEGILRHANDMFFYRRAVDFHFRHNQDTEALALTDSLLKEIPENIVLHDGRAVALYNLHRYNECIAVARHILSLDSEHQYAHYYIGASYCHLAEDIAVPHSAGSKVREEAYAKRKAYYKQALSSLQKFRELRPDEDYLWAPNLYYVYLNLNMGEDFDDITRYIQSHGIKVEDSSKR